MTIMYGRDFAYAATRLARTIVRIAKTNEPVVVMGVSSTNGDCTISDLESARTGEFNFQHIPLDDLDVTPVKLGYVNVSGDAIYLQRAPVRHGPGNQGLCQRNCLSSGPGLFEFPTDALRLCIMGRYPSYSKALAASKIKKRNGKEKTIAFNRHWAIRAGKELLYKNKEVAGSIVNGKPVLFEKFKYLEEYLGECL